MTIRYTSDPPTTNKVANHRNSAWLGCCLDDRLRNTKRMPQPIIKYGTAERSVSSTTKAYVLLAPPKDFPVRPSVIAPISIEIEENNPMLPRWLASGFSHGLAMVLGLAFCRIGLLHWTNPEPFEAIVPAYLGAPSFWNLLSGSFEIAFGAGLIFPRTRKHAAKLLFFLVIAMSLANLNMWINDLPFNGTKLSTQGHVVRWCIQIVLLLLLAWMAQIHPFRREHAPRD